MEPLVCDIDSNKEGLKLEQSRESLVEKSAPILPMNLAIILGLLNIAPGKTGYLSQPRN